MLINEHFGPTIQGEGINTGQRVGFIRLANCNLSCSWCDTPYSWNWQKFDKGQETHEVSTQELTEAIKSWGVDKVILTGGEPLMQQSAIVELIEANKGVKFDIETNGTIKPVPSLEAVIDTFVVSPKLSHSGDNLKLRLKASLGDFKRLADEGRAIIKVVVQDPADFVEIDLLCQAYGFTKNQIWVMPEGATKEKQLENLPRIADKAITLGYNISPRLHVLIWDSKRGV